MSRAERLAIAILSAASALAAGCSGGQTGSSAPAEPSAATADVAAPSEAAGKCLALADAVRPKKPGEPDQVTVSHVLIK
ncbi:MAG TPA: foldase, partial [Polyangiaceae bacterium]|nr:foldase [Polyangiaceae bacterium]